jgi:hypothetical protein
MVKAFQTIVTLACGLCVYKIVQRYGFSFRKSFAIMLLFIFNPLVIYDAAVWGHQDSFLILFLLIALWAYESGHPKIAYSSVTLAILVKSTAFAPGIVLIIFLLKKYGLRKLFDGILVGLGTGLAAILPYTLSGASPAMLVDSTVIRVFQFGSLAFQYPRSAAVSPDGYNIWPLFTYFSGAHGRDRMWFPDFVQIFPGMSYLLLGEILFIAFSLVIIYLGIKNEASDYGGASLLLGVMMVASTIFLTKTTARYLIFGVAFLIVSNKIINEKVKWLIIGILTGTSVFAMHGLLVGYTGLWTHLYPGMSTDIPFNNLIYNLYVSDSVMTIMILTNLIVFLVLFATTVRHYLRLKTKSKQSNT